MEVDLKLKPYFSKKKQKPIFLQVFLPWVDLKLKPYFVMLSKRLLTAERSLQKKGRS